MKRISETVKVDAAIFPAAVSSNGSTSAYFDMTGFGRALFVWSVVLASAGLTTTSTGTVYQATDGNGTDAAALADSTAILTASPKLTSLTITPQTAIATGDTFTITTYNGDGEAYTALVYTLTACGTADATIIRGVDIADTASGTAIFSNVCTTICAAINGSDGSIGLYGSATATTVTLRSLDGGETVFLFTASNTTNFTITTGTAVGMIEVGAGALTTSSNFTHLALNVVNQSAYYTSAVCIRGEPSRFMPYQQASVITTL